MKLFMSISLFVFITSLTGQVKFQEVIEPLFKPEEITNPITVAVVECG